MAEEGNGALSNAGVAPEQSLQVDAPEGMETATPTVCQDEDCAEVSKEEAAATQLDPSKTDPSSERVSVPPLEAESEQSELTADPSLEAKCEPSELELSLVPRKSIEEEARRFPKLPKGDAPTGDLESSEESSSAIDSMYPLPGRRELELGESSPPLQEGESSKGAVGGLVDDQIRDLRELATIMSGSVKPGKLKLLDLYLRPTPYPPPPESTSKNPGRKRHEAGCPSRQDKSSDQIPRPILNQAGAIVGYTGPRPQRDGQEAEEEERSISRASTAPIGDVFLPFFIYPLPLTLAPSESVAASPSIAISEVSEETAYPLSERSSRALSDFDSLSGDARESPQAAESIDPDDTRSPGANQAMDIPGRPESDPAPSKSSRRTFLPFVAARRYSLPFEPCGSLTREGSPPRRKISQDSTSSSERHRPFSRESSVELEEYMTSKAPENDPCVGDEEGALADTPLPAADLYLPEEEMSESTEDTAMDSTQQTISGDSSPELTDEGGMSELSND